MNRKEFLQRLFDEKILIIEFTKVDGSLRKMAVQDLSTVVLPEKSTKEPVKERKQKSENIIVVYSRDDEGFRSFDINRLISINGVNIND